MRKRSIDAAGSVLPMLEAAGCLGDVQVLDVAAGALVYDVAWRTTVCGGRRLVSVAPGSAVLDLKQLMHTYSKCSVSNLSPTFERFAYTSSPRDAL